MLLPPADAQRFLFAYKALLEAVSGRPLSGTQDFAEARNAFFADPKIRKKPPTADPELIAALKTASWGQFRICRHLVRATEMIDSEDRVYRVRGITTELRDMTDAWVIVETAVMQFAGIWVCDGLLRPYNVRIGPNMRKELLATIRNA